MRIENIQNIKYKNYKINTVHNNLVYQTLFKVDDYFKEINEKYLIGGSLSLALRYKKVYRTIKDIDLNVCKYNFNNLNNLLRGCFILHRQTPAHKLFIYPENGIEIDFATYLYGYKKTSEVCDKIEFKNKTFNVIKLDILWFYRGDHNTKLLDIEDYHFYKQFEKKYKDNIFENISIE
jgi:hypothetical protein